MAPYERIAKSVFGSIFTFRKMKKLLLIVFASTALIVVFLRLQKPPRIVEPTKAVNFVGSTTSSSVHDIPLQVTQVRPNYVKVYNSFKVGTPEDLNSYLEKRKPQLSELAKATPNREIEVVISPSRKLSLEEFGRKSIAQGLLLDELSLDVFINDAWDHTVWFDKNTSVVDISQDASVLTTRIVEIESSNSMPPSSSLPPDGRMSPQPPKMDLAVRYARGRIKAVEAANLQTDPAILLVDPTTDLADEFKAKGQEVRVYQMPQLYVEKELRWGEIYRNKSSRRSQ